MIWKIILAVVIAAYLALNVVIAKKYKASEMKEKFVDGQYIVGAIFTNVLYAPAWFLKFLKIAAMTMIA